MRFNEIYRKITSYIWCKVETTTLPQVLVILLSLLFLFCFGFFCNVSLFLFYFRAAMSLTLDLLYKVIGVKHEPLVKWFSPGYQLLATQSL